jgi:hypothetical protein
MLAGAAESTSSARSHSTDEDTESALPREPKEK